MLKWIGAILGGVTVMWMVVQREQLSVFPLCAGAALVAALFAILCPIKEKAPPLPINNTAQQVEMVKKEAMRAVDALKGEMQKMEQRSSRADERSLSYQKLVDVHQNEITGLRQENLALAEELAQKEKKLTALHFARQEPDLFN